ncbi:hypothetical protein EG329_001955 [Mollisiaceae sp. DMI_Dod_QoI]|nr:hypothetical protein EG329_001955 [Helotiales sp. DMI_Dod_QoI]
MDDGSNNAACCPTKREPVQSSREPVNQWESGSSVSSTAARDPVVQGRKDGCKDDELYSGAQVTKRSRREQPNATVRESGSILQWRPYSRDSFKGERLGCRSVPGLLELGSCVSASLPLWLGRNRDDRPNKTWPTRRGSTTNDPTKTRDRRQEPGDRICSGPAAVERGLFWSFSADRSASSETCGMTDDLRKKDDEEASLSNPWKRDHLE